MDDMDCGQHASAAAAAAKAGSSRSPNQRKQQFAAEKVRLNHGQVAKAPGAYVSISRTLARVPPTAEQLLFWQLFMRFTKHGSTRWGSMAGVSCFTAAQRH